MGTIKPVAGERADDVPVFAPLGTEYLTRNVVRRVGVIDVGSNSVRLVVFDGVARSPAYFYNEKILCG
ncbi:MAG: exopolyphosphatase, partial [Pseudomonadota bacterium]